jgi:hypothetical protein
MTEEIFEKLGFIKEVVTMEESGNDEDFYYYTLDIGDICIISNADYEAAEKGWEAFIFDSNTMLINNPNDLKQLIKIIKSNTKDKKTK